MLCHVHLLSHWKCLSCCEDHYVFIKMEYRILLFSYVLHLQLCMMNLFLCHWLYSKIKFQMLVSKLGNNAYSFFNSAHNNCFPRNKILIRYLLQPSLHTRVIICLTMRDLPFVNSSSSFASFQSILHNVRNKKSHPRCLV